MKRIAFCFDGTWNKLDAKYSTNVVITAESILPLARDDTAQLIYYDEGVGTGKSDYYRGGAFGMGLVENIDQAYRFLIFNYTAGDEIYIFGFSRGAYTARSFAGLIGTCGIPVRKNAGRVKEAIEKYKSRVSGSATSEIYLRFRSELCPEVCVSQAEWDWRKENIPDFDESKATIASIRYLGVWDTVGALGIPASLTLLHWVNKKHLFHDTNLSAFVRSARHAVAIDEVRRDFAPTLWTNIEVLNTEAGHKGDYNDAPYQQVWFPGNHGSVGGGGERRGLSDQALDWILEGAKKCGLEFDHGPHSRIFELNPDYNEFLENSKHNGFFYWAMSRIMPLHRNSGQITLSEVNLSAKRRWKSKQENQHPYRPAPLHLLSNDLDNMVLESDAFESQLETKSKFELYVVQRNDTLSQIAKEKLGDAKRAKDIFRLNLDRLESIHKIYAGSTIRIPVE